MEDICMSPICHVRTDVQKQSVTVPCQVIRTCSIRVHIYILKSKHGLLDLYKYLKDKNTANVSIQSNAMVYCTTLC